MATDPVTLNVGGRLFQTTRGTLEFSKARFFEALLMRWNYPPPEAAVSNAISSENMHSSQCDTIDSTGRPAKRRLAESQIGPIVLQVDSEATREPTVLNPSSGTGTIPRSGPSSSPIFIDRDPDAFEDVLYFMRCQQIKPSTRVDGGRIQQLQIEAEFLGYDDLAQACEVSLADLVELHRPVITSAYSDTVVLGKLGAVNRARREFEIPTGHLLYVDFASIWGLETLDEARLVNMGVYRRSNEPVPTEHTQVRSVSILCSGKRNMENPFARRIGICISSPEKNEKIGLFCLPFMTGILWQVHCWIGTPDKIPPLSGGAPPGQVRRLQPSPLDYLRPDPHIALLLQQQESRRGESAAAALEEHP